MVDKLKIEMIKIEKISEYQNNAKLHPDFQIEQIANSIKKFGFNDPIAIDSKNIIIEGHGRLKAAELLKMKKVPVIRLDHLSEAEKKAYIIAHNKLTTATGYDEEVIAREIEEILKYDPKMNLNEVGINLKDLEKFEKQETTPEDEFQKKVDEYNDVNCKMPIVPKFFEKHECFIIPVHNEIDEKFIRDVFGLNENHISESGDGKIRKSNVINIEAVRCLVR